TSKTSRLRSHPSVLHLGQANERQEADVEPTHVELVPLGLELGRVRVGVMVVVELLAAGPDRERRDVPALVLDLEVPIPDRVADAVDDAGGPEGDPDHLHAPDDRANHDAEEVQVDAEEQDDAQRVAPGENMPLEPIVRRALAVLLEHAGLADGLPIVE